MARNSEFSRILAATLESPSRLEIATSFSVSDAQACATSCAAVAALIVTLSLAALRERQASRAAKKLPAQAPSSKSNAMTASRMHTPAFGHPASLAVACRKSHVKRNCIDEWAGRSSGLRLIDANCRGALRPAACSLCRGLSHAERWTAEFKDQHSVCRARR